MDFPSMKASQLRRVLARKPLSYRMKKVGHTKSGSHVFYQSPNGYPDVLFSFHPPSLEIPARVVKKVLMTDVGLTEDQAKAAIKGDLK